MATVKFSKKNLPRGRTDWKALRKLSDKEIERRASSDPDSKPLTDRERRTLRRSPRSKMIRMALGMTQEEFARSFELSLATVRDWEQGRSEPDSQGKTLLKLIERIPQQVRKALAGKAGSGAHG